jgi:signal transduction histidine kinase
MELTGTHVRTATPRGIRLPAVPKLPLVVAPVVAAAAVVTALAFVRLGVPSWNVLAGAGVLLAASIAAEAFPVPIVGVAAGATSLATIFIVAAGVLYSWPVAALIGLLTMLAVEARRQMTPIRVVYNTALYVLSGSGAGLVAAHIGNVPVAVLSAAAAFYATDIGLLAAVVAASGSERYGSVLRTFTSSTLVPFVVMAATTAILVELWHHSAPTALLLLPPLVTIAFYQRSLHRAMERQRELDRLKEEFIAVVSHELRTPLSTVYGGVETLQRSDLRPEVRESVFRVIRQEATRLAKLVDDVLWASRVEARPADTPADVLRPADVIEDVAELARASAPESVELVTRVPAALPEVAAHRAHVERILTNLVENAIKYSPSGGSIEIGASPADRMVRFHVRDEGIGIPAAECERIFEKFTRLDPQMARGISGTGLGLYICRELVRQLGGDIRCAPNEGAGTTFTFDIPISA